MDEVKDKNAKQIDTSSRKQEVVDNLPLQKNGRDVEWIGNPNPGSNASAKEKMKSLDLVFCALQVISMMNAGKRQPAAKHASNFLHDCKQRNSVKLFAPKPRGLGLAELGLADIVCKLPTRNTNSAQFFAPKPRGLGLADAESANCLRDSDLLFRLAVPGGNGNKVKTSLTLRAAPPLESPSNFVSIAPLTHSQFLNQDEQVDIIKPLCQKY
ncbi:hypothetical protein ACMD2_22577 [Ananas comosus]|uniref:Uncharacterized protein n=1 Tax=Ananas comosus TaxID=4615 RepID=A0A199V2P4_ANACO|nr:hypothetical protein ACMD2_22577 [Ananas comosus]